MLCTARGRQRRATGEHDIHRAVEPGGFRVEQFFLLPSAWRKSTVQKVRRASENAWPSHCTPEFTRLPLPRLGAGASVGMTYFLHTEARISMPDARWPHGLCCAARCVARVSPRTLHKKHRTVCDVAAGPCLHRSACGYTRSLVGPVSVSELVFAGMACPMYKVYAMCAVVTVERV